MEDIINYVKAEIEKERYPSYKELDKQFNLYRRNINIFDVYSKFGFSLLNLPVKRPQNSYAHLKQELIDYLKGEIEKDNYPSRREIEKRFKVRIGNIFGTINNLYSHVNMPYKQKNNQELKIKKAKILTNIMLDVLPKLNLELKNIAKVHQKGIDILAEDSNNNLIGIELKAFNKYEPIKKKNLEQVKRFLVKYNLKKAILVTTTKRCNKIELPNNIEIIFYDDLMKLCNMENIKKLDFIRNYSIHKETYEREKKRAKMIKYAREMYIKDKDISYESISRDLNLNIRTYFNNIYDLYYKANIPVPQRKIYGFKCSKPYKKTEKARNALLKRMLQYISEEVKKGRYPSGIEIGNKFGISHIWSFINVSDLYKQLGLQPYHSRKKRRHRKNN